MHLILITTMQHIDMLGSCLQLGVRFKKKPSHTCKANKHDVDVILGTQLRKH